MEPSSFTAVVPWVGLLALALWITGRNTLREAGRRSGWCIVAALWLRLVPLQLFAAADGDGGLTLHFLDVGQGDGALIRTPGGRWLVMDAGPVSGRDDAGRRVVAPFLQRHRVRALTAILVSLPAPQV